MFQHTAFIFFRRGGKLHPATSSSFLPAAKPSGPRTVRVVVADGVGGGLVWICEVARPNFHLRQPLRLQKLVSIQIFCGSGDEILQSHWPAQWSHNLAFRLC